MIIIKVKIMVEWSSIDSNGLKNVLQIRTIRYHISNLLSQGTVSGHGQSVFRHSIT